MSKIFLDIDLSLELDSSSLVFTNPETDNTVSYLGYMSMTETEQSLYVIDSVQDLINNSIVLEVYRTDINTPG